MLLQNVLDSSFRDLRDFDANGPLAAETAMPFVAIVVPMLNEENYIAACLSSLLAQAQERDSGATFEILAVDGGSTDATLEIVEALQREHPCIRLLHNPQRLQSAAMNLAARAASPGVSVMVRADAHAYYPPGFLTACVDALAQSGATSVVVPMKTVGNAGFQRAVAAAQNSRLGNGGSAHRTATSSRFVDHGHHAAFDRSFFLSIGGYDETFSHNEDAEYDHRVGLAGGNVWMCGDVAVTYYPRRHPWGLATQYFRHGKGRARTLLTHQIRPRPRQLLPLLILSSVICGLLFAAIHPIFAFLPLAYATLCTAWGAGVALRRRDPWLLAMGPAAMIMHLSWASGFVRMCLAQASLPIPRPAGGDTYAPASARLMRHPISLAQRQRSGGKDRVRGVSR